MEVKNMGIHVAKGANLAKSLQSAMMRYGLASAQIFTHGPQSMSKVKYDADEVREITQRGLRLYVHSTYLTTVWRDMEHDMNHTIAQFEAADDAGALGVVIHLPKMESDRIAFGVNELVRIRKAKGLNAKIILEMKALTSHKTQSYETPRKIMDLVAEMTKYGISSEDVGICIDTAHIAAGKAQIRTYEMARHYLASIDRQWIALIHLNGNEYDGNIRAGDKHCLALSEADKVWNSIDYEDSGCRAFVEYAQEFNIDFIMELHYEGKEMDSAISTFKTYMSS
jgi:endonuclease IV